MSETVNGNKLSSTRNVSGYLQSCFRLSASDYNRSTIIKNIQESFLVACNANIAHQYSMQYTGDILTDWSVIVHFERTV